MHRRPTPPHCSSPYTCYYSCSHHSSSMCIPLGAAALTYAGCTYLAWLLQYRWCHKHVSTHQQAQDEDNINSCQHHPDTSHESAHLVLPWPRLCPKLPLQQPPQLLQPRLIGHCEAQRREAGDGHHDGFAARHAETVLLHLLDCAALAGLCCSCLVLWIPPQLVQLLVHQRMALGMAPRIR